MHLKLLRLFRGRFGIRLECIIIWCRPKLARRSRCPSGSRGRPIAYDRMLDYCLRMAAGAFSLVGVLFLVLAVQPIKHRGIIP